MSRVTIQKALRELKAGSVPGGQVRRSGGGRKDVLAHEERLLADLEELITPTPRGDRMAPLRWTCKSSRQLAQALQQGGHPVGADSVPKLLHAAEYSLQANAQTLEGSHPPDRDAPFEYLNEQVKACLAHSLPVVAMATQKQEWVGQFTNEGPRWQPTGQPEPVNVHAFPDPLLGKAIPYGL